VKRRLFVAASVSAALAGCATATNQINQNAALHSLLRIPERLDHALIGTRGSAKLYGEADITHDFPTNGLDTPSDATYAALRQSNFATYRLPVSGLVDRPQSFDMRQLRAMASLSEITRHDCVEGWSVVGKFGGVPLGTFLQLVKPKRDARYLIFYSFDRDQNGQQFYGSLDLVQASHPQTMLQMDLNGKPLDADHGAPVRLRVPTQLAYKSTKWVQRIEVASSYGHVFGGQGGYWEDDGYEWYAGI
jgi:DMSO/TMAO reductase YedYZ molybdopterin-dependent catalytic subunit